VHALRSLIATRASLLVAGRQAALLEAMWLDELRREQAAPSSLRLTFAPALCTMRQRGGNGIA
jgi:hypothetical protein